MVPGCKRAWDSVPTWESGGIARAHGNYLTIVKVNVHKTFLKNSWNKQLSTLSPSIGIIMSYKLILLYLQ